MMTPEERLKQLGIELPDAPKPLGSYVPLVSTGNLVFLSGMLPLVEGKLTREGRVGEKVTVDEAREDARTAAINALAILKSNLGTLNKIRRCVKITGYVSSAPNFAGQPDVLNAASDFMFEIFGEVGRHARAAVGVSALPLNSPVELDFIFEVS
ncbi:MAG: RidA family protein [Thermodesulfovibrionales bacterium]|nr:RidA family protein [Thermodesulfovibrionales bacterium]